MATHSSIFAWRIPRTGAWRATVHGVTELDTTGISGKQGIAFFQCKGVPNIALDKVTLENYPLLSEIPSDGESYI